MIQREKNGGNICRTSTRLMSLLLLVTTILSEQATAQSQTPPVCNNTLLTEPGGNFGYIAMQQGAHDYTENIYLFEYAVSYVASGFYEEVNCTRTMDQIVAINVQPVNESNPSLTYISTRVNGHFYMNFTLDTSQSGDLFNYNISVTIKVNDSNTEINRTFSRVFTVTKILPQDPIVG